MSRPIDTTPSERDRLVMDVRLKREYAKGLISNYEVGIGPSLYGNPGVKWLGRVFAMYYTPAQSIALYANANNLNDTRRASSSGEWQKVDAGNGEITVKSAGIDYSFKNQPHQTEFNTTFQAERRNVELTRQVVTENFFSGGNTRSDSKKESTSGSTNINWNARLFKRWNWGWIEVKPTAYYRHGSLSAITSARSGNVNGFTSESETPLYNREQRETDKNNDHGVSLNCGFAILSPLRFALKYINVTVYGSYDSRQANGSISDKIEYLLHTSPDIAEGQRDSRPGHGYKYGMTIAPFSFQIGNADKIAQQGSIDYTYEQQYYYGARFLNRRGLNADSIATTPSATSSWVLDEANSYHTSRFTRSHKLAIDYMLIFPKGQLQISCPIMLFSRRIFDRRDNTPLVNRDNDAT